MLFVQSSVFILPDRRQEALTQRLSAEALMIIGAEKARWGFPGRRLEGPKNDHSKGFST